MKIRLDGRLVQLALGLIRRKNLDPISALRGLVGCDHHHAVSFRLLRGGAIRVKPYDDLVSTVAQILRLRMSLAAVADDRDGFALQGVWVGVFLVKNSSHGSSSGSVRGRTVSPL